jgi:hypothetical protein
MTSRQGTLRWHFPAQPPKDGTPFDVTPIKPNVGREVSFIGQMK